MGNKNLEIENKPFSPQIIAVFALVLTLVITGIVYFAMKDKLLKLREDTKPAPPQEIKK